MPTYEYKCPQGHEFERFYKTISAAQAEVPCPECGAIAARQLSAGAGLLFKGSGFYLTDYGKNAHRKPAPEGGKSETKGESKSDSSSAKPDTTKADTAKSPDSGTPAPTKSKPKAE
ncbi:MAG TPA: FmdB family zinc ribbon protein [Gemmatimonadaceae bacterium]|nr:FmdB family zinc ribbon protein [Gemmatimonadaceae bacterium]